MSLRFIHIGGLFALGALAGRSVAAQVPAAAPLDWSADDSNRVAWLSQHGRTVAGRYATLVAPSDSFPVAWQRALVDSLDRGVAALRRLIGGPYPWQRIADRPVQFYIAPDRFISHASGHDVVFISLALVRRGVAPFLHEASHELLAPTPPFFWWEYADSIAGARAAAAMPLWLLEGFPDYLAQTAAAAEGLREGDIFEIGGLAQADSVCAARATASAHRADLLRVVGATGRLEALFTTDRATVAPAFYACSQSMTKFLVDVIGVRHMLALLPAMKAGTWQDEIDRAAGAPLPELRRQWLRELGLTDP